MPGDDAPDVRLRRAVLVRAKGGQVLAGRRGHRPPVNGFFPVALRTGQAWVPAADTKRPTRLQSCFVWRLRDGRLLYSSHDRIQGD